WGLSNSIRRPNLASQKKIRVRPGILAVDALNLMQSRHITSVLVADGDQLLGVLHMHDLLRAGVV
ncbi:CBS domain-containing protein, partial [Salmonella enterica]|uniref:CBS domain-containing protein n=1 Tax=Salmonella enterica TaxID=28901 RepID=UPI00111A5C18